MILKGQNLRKPITPLWIIALFVSLTETVVGTAVIKTNGEIQLVLTVFVVVFPIFIASLFFMILWNRPYVLYPPTEYGNGTDINNYVDAIQRKGYDKNKLYSSIQEIIHASITSDEIVSKLSQLTKNSTTKSTENQISQVLNTAVGKAVKRISEINFITIDTRPLLGDKGKLWQVVYGQYNNISDFLDDIWFSLAPHGVKSYTYGIGWVLRDSQKNRIVFDNAIRVYIESRGRFRDLRNLEDVGLNPGMTLEVISFNERF